VRFEMSAGALRDRFDGALDRSGWCSWAGDSSVGRRKGRRKVDLRVESVSESFTVSEGRSSRR